MSEEQQCDKRHEDARNKAKADFVAWFVDQYPVGCILHKPVWHAPKIFRAVEAFLDDHAPRPHLASAPSHARQSEDEAVIRADAALAVEEFLRGTHAPQWTSRLQNLLGHILDRAFAPSTTPQKPGETPRADALRKEIASYHRADQAGCWYKEYGQLERELAQALDDAERLHDDKIALVRKYVTGDPRNEPTSPSATPLFTKEEADNLLSVIWDSPFACIESSVSKLEAIAGRSIRRPDGGKQTNG